MDSVPHGSHLRWNRNVCFDLTQACFISVRRENVKRYRLLLEQITDEAECRRIQKLLSEETKKQQDAGDMIDE
jgi:hypothetical protein